MARVKLEVVLLKSYRVKIKIQKRTTLLPPIRLVYAENRVEEGIFKSSSLDFSEHLTDINLLILSIDG